MLELLKSIDRSLFLFLNGMHNGFFDFIMYWASDRFIWIPFYAFLLLVVVRRFGKKTVVILFLIAAMIAVSDQVASNLAKNYFHRLRPCHVPELISRVHLVNNECGGTFGFFSSHASNSWALAVFLILVLQKKKPSPDGKVRTKHSRTSWLLIGYAALVSFSRIYLGSHYPSDVITGIAFGSLLSFIFAQIFFRFQNR